MDVNQRRRISVVSILLGAFILLLAVVLFSSQALRYYYEWQLRLNRKEVLRALVELGEAEKAEDWCIDTLESEDVSERKLAAEFLGELRSVRAIPYLIDRFRKSEICIGTLQQEHLELKVESDYLGTALASIGEPAIPLLIDMMGADGDHWRASGVLGRIGPPAIPHLLRALEDGNQSARVGAASALSKIGPRARVAVPLLISSLRNKDNHQRQFFAVALGNIGPEAESAVPALLEALNDEDEYVRKCSASALGKIGLASREVVDSLTSKLDDSARDVQSCAREALSLLRSSGESRD